MYIMTRFAFDPPVQSHPRPPEQDAVIHSASGLALPKGSAVSMVSSRHIPEEPELRSARKRPKVARTSWEEEEEGVRNNQMKNRQCPSSEADIELPYVDSISKTLSKATCIC
jgi:hypothetical protein